MQKKIRNRIALNLVLIVALAAVLTSACDDKPKVQANIQIPVSDSFGMGEVALNALISLLNGQIAPHLPEGTTVVLVPATQARNLLDTDGPRIVLTRGDTLTATRVGRLITVTIPAGTDPQDPAVVQALQEKVLEAVGGN